MNNRRKTYLSLLGVTALVLILDQWSKYLVRTYLPVSQIYKPDLGPFSFIEFVYLQNSGALMSSFKGMNVLFISLAVIICGILLFAAPRVAGENGAMRLALGLLLGGVTGNMIDRILFKSVTDFIIFWNSAIVNIADLSIFLGVLIMAYAIWVQERKPTEPPQGSEANTSLPKSGSLPEDDREVDEV